MKKIFTLSLLTICTIMAYATVDITLTSVDVKKSSVINKPVSVSGQVLNSGTETIYAFEITWNANGKNEVYKFNSLEILPGETYSFSNIGYFTLSEPKKYEISMSVSSVNYASDYNFSDNTITQQITGTSRAAVKKAVAEEATGTWCGWCPRGAVYMELSRDEFGDQFIGIAVHNSDPMENNTYDAAIGSYPGFSGYPSVILDRKLLIDPSGLLTQIPNRLDNDPIAEINVYGDYDAVNRTLHVVASATFLAEETELDYRLNVVLTEDGVTGTTAGYNQTNYYAGGGYGSMYGWEDLPSSVPAADMVYDFVAREIVDGWDGSEGSVPTSVSAGQTVTYEYDDIDIDEDWDENNISVIVLLTDYDDPKNEIINANSVKLTEIVTDVNDLNHSYDVDIYPNPAVNETFVRIDLTSAADLSMNITDMNGNIVASQTYGVQTGDIALPVNTSSLASGIYLVNVIAGGEHITHKLHVTH